MDDYVIIKQVFGINGKINSKKGGKNKDCSYSYDNLNRLKFEIIEDYLIKEFFYKDDSNLIDSTKTSYSFTLKSSEENFFYNDENLLIKKVFINNNKPSSQIDYYYNDKNLLVSKETYQIDEFDNQISETLTRIYEYNDKDLLIYEFQEDECEMFYEYNDQNQLIKEEYTDLEEDSFTSVDTYEYDDKGNISRHIEIFESFFTEETDRIEIVYQNEYLVDFDNHLETYDSLDEIEIEGI